MADCGVNIPRDGAAHRDVLRSLGATWLRIVAMPDVDLSEYFRQCRTAGMKILLVLARESTGDYRRYKDLYGSLVDSLQVGNEPDGEGESSWQMSQAEFVSLGKAARKIFGSMPIVAGGMVSGHPEWLAEVDLSWADAIAVHPYGKSPSKTWPHPGWGTGYMGDLLDGYAAYGKPLLVTELGLSTDQVDEGFQAEYLTRCGDYLNHRDDVEAWCWFCLDDERMVPKFGLMHAEGDEKPSANAFRDQAAKAIHSLWPEVQAPTGPPVEPPTLPDPWQWWTVPQIAQAAQCPLDAVRDNWPRLTEQFHHCGLTDQNIWIGMIGKCAIESASTFRPVREAFYLGEPEPAESHRKTLRYYPYYGRGFIQNTWRENYAALGPQIAALWGAGPDDPTFDLVANPDNLLDPDMSAAAAAIYFRDHGGGALAAAARAGNWSEVRRLVLGGPDPQGVARITRIATVLGPGKPTDPPVEPPVPPTDPYEVIAAYETALKTLRDQTLPAAIAANDLSGKGLRDAMRICEQMVGKA